MISTKEEWNAKFLVLKESLKKCLKKPEKDFPELLSLANELNGSAHESSAKEQKEGIMSIEDLLWQEDGDFFHYTPGKIYSPAWHLWHSARIEDITASCLILEKPEVFDEKGFFERLGVPFRHTGNSMNLTDMEVFNSKLNIRQLRNYRKAVGVNSKKAIKSFTPELLANKVPEEGIKAITEHASVTDSDSWLLDYWGKKTGAGILLMPLTRHLLVHLNSSRRLLK